MNVSTLVQMCNNAGYEVMAVEIGNGFVCRSPDGALSAEYDDEESAARACLRAVFDQLPGMERLALAFENSFMKPVIEQGQYFEVETGMGTEIVPADVIGRTVGTAAEAFENYVEGNIADPDEVIECQSGWLARVSANGYMDCSTWSVHKSADEAADYLIEHFGEEI